jgi:tetratricopeptide (TPR) repeat protein
VNRRAALYFLLSSAGGCGRPQKAAPAPRGVQALLSAGHDFGESTSEEESLAWTELQRIAEIARGASSEAPAAPADALIRTLYTTLSFVREVEDSDLSFVLLPSVVRRRRGSCVGLGTLYLALAEMLGIPSSGVLLPGHFFVRVEERGQQRNVELLRQGEEMPEAWYRERYPIQGGKVSAYGRALSADEVLGVVEYDLGNQRRRRGRLHDAKRAYQRAARHFPEFAEAQASLGAVLHLLGALEEAGTAYRAAERANPWLPGLAKNIELLTHERARRAASP